MDDFSWIFKRRLGAFTVIAAVEAIVIGGVFATWDADNKIKSFLAIIIALLAQYIIYKAWKESKGSKEGEDGKGSGKP